MRIFTEIRGRETIAFIGAAACFLAAAPARADEAPSVGIVPQLSSQLLRHSQLYDEGQAGREVMRRIRSGVYDGYNVELCVDDVVRCNFDIFTPYRIENNGTVGYSIEISSQEIDSYAPEVIFEIVEEILYFSWGHSKRAYSPLLSSIQTKAGSTSPLETLSPTSATMFGRFGKPEYLQGGLGGNAYGPNCWYNSIAAIADARSEYASSKALKSGLWDSPRFMGPTEYRCHMKQFTAVSAPQYGDIVRYYVNDPIYSPKDNIFGGELHAAIFVGKESSPSDWSTSRKVVLTKNGRSDLDFLIFQDLDGLDKIYFKGENIKHFMRVNESGSLLDPATAGQSAACYDEYLVDRTNYRDRLECLAGRLDPPPGENRSCYDYPAKWLTGKDAPATSSPDFNLQKDSPKLLELGVWRLGASG